MARTVAGMKRKAADSDGARKKARSSMSKSFGVPYAKFHRLGYIDNWSFGTISSNGFWRNYQPQLGTLLNFAEYSALFDVYKVSKVKITFLPNFSGVQGNRQGGGTLDQLNQQFYIAYGVQKGVIEAATGTYGNASFNTFCQNYNNIKIKAFDKPVSITFKPQINDTLGNGTALIPCPWVSTNSLDVAMLGCGAYLFDNNFVALNSAGLTCNVHVDFWFECKGSR